MVRIRSWLWDMFRVRVRITVIFSLGLGPVLGLCLGLWLG
jgi:hypothetical protein